jgi:lysyl endopeptidase
VKERGTRMKKIIFFATFVLLFCFAIYGQITTGEDPVSFGTNMPALATSEKSVKSFGTLDMKKIEQEDLADKRNGLPPRFGYPHEAGFTLENSGEWIVLPNGDRL